MEKEIKRLEKELAECKKEKDEYLNGWKRAKADYANYKKEESERISRIINYREDEIILDFISIVDSFDNAEKEISKDDIEKNDLVKGFLRIKDNLINLIKKMGVEKMESLGKPFDPNFHEAVELTESNGESGIVTEEISKGYLRDGRVIRATKVKVIK